MNGPWFPIIISDKCDGCAKTGKPRCVEFCSNGVFVFQNGQSVVANPANCGKDCSIPNCSACAPLCHNKAISFPKRNVMHSQAAHVDNDMLRKAVCPKCKKITGQTGKPTCALTVKTSNREAIINFSLIF